LREGLSLWGHGPQLPGRPATAMAAAPATTAVTASSGGASAAETAGTNSACQISGSVSYRERMALLPGDELLVQLLDASQPDAPPRVLSEQRLSNPGQVPLHFLLSCDAKLPGQQANFLIAARILRDGRPLFSGSMPLPPGDQTKDLELMLSQMRGLPAKPNAENSR
ncbi:MAG TPA: YbaY family lipoprotein, partial [Methylibium sp.]